MVNVTKSNIVEYFIQSIEWTTTIIMVITDCFANARYFIQSIEWTTTIIMVITDCFAKS